MKKKRQLFALADCNNFFVSCERVFDPRLEGRPVIVLSSNDACIVSRSNEAKQLGVKMGVPLFQTRDITGHGKVSMLSANFTLYRDLSRRITHCFRQFCHDIEIYSVDEAFMTFPESDSRTIDTMIRNMRRTVLQWVGVPVSIGVAETKTLAKLAAEYAKKHPSTDGCFDLFSCSSDERDRVMEATPVDDIWGIGRQHTKWLNERDIKTALQLRGINQDLFGRKAGVTGLRTVKELQGISCVPMEFDMPPRKDITCSRSFGKPVTELRELREAIATFATHSGRELRHDGSQTRCMTVYCGVKPSGSNPRTYVATTVGLSMPTDRDSDLIRAALTGLEKIYRPGLSYCKGGVTLHELSRANVRQTDIFAPEADEGERPRKLNDLVDHLNAHWGYGTIRYAATGAHGGWQPKSIWRSPNYTTRWDELPVALAASSR